MNFLYLKIVNVWQEWSFDIMSNNFQLEKIYILRTYLLHGAESFLRS